jgi:hypothetical protein
VTELAEDEADDVDDVEAFEDVDEVEDVDPVDDVDDVEPTDDVGEFDEDEAPESPAAREPPLLEQAVKIRLTSAIETGFIAVSEGGKRVRTYCVRVTADVHGLPSMSHE